MEREPTKEELDLKNALELKGVNVKEEFNDGFKTVDLRIEEAKLDIEVDGEQHLTNPKQILSDLNRGYWSQKKAGYGTVHVPNILVRINLPKIASALSTAIKIRAEKLKFKFRTKA